MRTLRTIMKRTLSALLALMMLLCAGGTASANGDGSRTPSTFAIAVAAAENGAAYASSSRAAMGVNVTIRVVPAEGYVLDTLSVMGSGTRISVTRNSDTEYAFRMPGSNVTVTPVFRQEAAPPAEDAQPMNPFTDVPAGKYYTTAVLWAVSLGVTNGATAATFEPARACTRAQTVTFLWRAAGSPAPQTAENPFTDVAERSYYYQAVLWALENGITKGTTATTFSPGATVSRAQVVTFLYRTSGKTVGSAVSANFTDVKAGSYYRDAVVWAAYNGITNGLTANTFGPNQTCTRGQIVTFLYRFYVL